MNTEGSAQFNYLLQKPLRSTRHNKARGDDEGVEEMYRAARMVAYGEGVVTPDLVRDLIEFRRLQLEEWDRRRALGRARILRMRMARRMKGLI